MPQSVVVLHVDDDPDFAALTADALERATDRISVVTATSVSDGLDRLADTGVDCIVSDYDMPGRDGIEFLRAVRADHPDLPFILFTGKGSETVASEAFSADATDYLQKRTGTDQFTLLANAVTNSVERYRAERERERRARAMETANEGIAILDEDGRYCELNDAYADHYGVESTDALLGEHWSTTVPDEEVDRLETEAFPRVHERGHWAGESVGLRADGSVYPKYLSLAALADGGHVCVVRETSDYKSLEEQFELITRVSTDAFWDWDVETGEITRSDGYLSQFGYDPADIDGGVDWWRERIHPDDRERVLAALDATLADPAETYDETYRLRRPDGSYGYVRSRGRVVYDADGEPERMVGAHIDITEQKEYERELGATSGSTSSRGSSHTTCATPSASPTATSNWRGRSVTATTSRTWPTRSSGWSR